ncbi:OsmC family protein [Alicyclobacillus curvatus]|jgi:peroxiredoxin-like protein|nr:OsmC family protein [Alicyclobacillus curvatus]
MADLGFEITLQWSGTGRAGEGTARLSNHEVTYSAPYSMGGKGVGSSPEEFLLAAVCSCYSATLFGVLKKAGLPAEQIFIKAEGTVTDYPVKSKFARIRVNPAIDGGLKANIEAYREAALTARDKCFIGKTIMGNVEYEVGEVTIN